MNVSTSSLELAPGRETWIVVNTFVQTSTTSMERVTPDVSAAATFVPTPSRDASDAPLGALGAG